MLIICRFNDFAEFIPSIKHTNQYFYTGSDASRKGVGGSTVRKEIENNMQQVREELMLPSARKQQQEVDELLENTVGSSSLEVATREEKRAIFSRIEKKFLKFRALDKPLTVAPETLFDHGYYYRMYYSDVRLVRHTMEDNGFIEVSARASKIKSKVADFTDVCGAQGAASEWSIMWSGTSLKSQIYQQLKM